MAGRQSKSSEQAEAAFKKSVEAGTPLTVLELSYKFKLSPSTIYRAKWHIEYQEKTAKAAQ